MAMQCSTIQEELLNFFTITYKTGLFNYSFQKKIIFNSVSKMLLKLANCYGTQCVLLESVHE